MTVRSNTFSQIAAALSELVNGGPDIDREEKAMIEARTAIESVIHTGRAIELAPQDARIRKMQHQLIEGKQLASESVGLDPERRIRILPVRLG